MSSYFVNIIALFRPKNSNVDTLFRPKNSNLMNEKAANQSQWDRQITTEKCLDTERKAFLDPHLKLFFAVGGEKSLVAQTLFS